MAAIASNVCSKFEATSVAGGSNICKAAVRAVIVYLPENSHGVHVDDNSRE